MDELQLLLKACGPGLYRNNPFRMLTLPVDASTREVNRQRDKILMAQRLGSDLASGNGLIALRPAPQADEVRLAAETLFDGAGRLVQELFWFWPAASGQAVSDPALKALSDGQIDDAQYLWLDAEKQNGAADIAQHNLAVLAHFSACEFEHQFHSDPPSPKIDRTVANDFWLRAFRRWGTLTREGPFWNRLAERIRGLDDPQLTPDLAEKLRRSLAPALLAINADFAVKAVEANDPTEAARHVNLIKKSGFGAEAIDQALRRAAEPIMQRITSITQKIKKDNQDNPAQALELFKSLVEETLPHLAIIAQFFAPGHLTYDSAHDEVVLVALQCQISYGNQSKDWKTCCELLQKLHAIAGGAAARTRIEENVNIVQDNYLDVLCLAADNVCKTDPTHADQAARTLLAEAGPVFAVMAPNHPHYEAAHDMVAGCTLACAVAYGNGTKDWSSSAELLQGAQNVAVGAVARQRITENLQIVRENVILRTCDEAVNRVKTKADSASETVEWLIRETQPALAWFPIGHPRRAEIHDAVALSALDCAILHGNYTGRWGATQSLLQRLEKLAASPAVKQRIISNIYVAGNNFRQAGYRDPQPYQPPPPPPPPLSAEQRNPFSKQHRPLLIGCVVTALVLFFLCDYVTFAVALAAGAFAWSKNRGESGSNRLLSTIVFMIGAAVIWFTVCLLASRLDWSSPGGGYRRRRR